MIGKALEDKLLSSPKEWSWSARTSPKDLARKRRCLAAVCRRFRNAFVRDLYRVIEQSPTRPTFRRTLPLLELLPLYGQHVNVLDLWIHPVPALKPYKSKKGRPVEIQQIHMALELPSLLASLASATHSLPNLRTFRLRLYPDGFGDEYAYREYEDVPPLAQETALSTDELLSLTTILKLLPKHLQELELHGFTMTDALSALRAANLPELIRLALNLSTPTDPELESAAFMDSLPITDIHLPAACAPPEWIARALGPKSLKCVTITPAEDESDGWRYEGTSEGVLALLAGSGSSLEAVGIETVSFPTDSAAQYLQNVTSITVTGISFGSGEADVDFEAYIGPFATLPALTSLRLLQCRGVPPSLLEWFIPDKSRVYFPKLKNLEAGVMGTQYGEDDMDGEPPSDSEYEIGDDDASDWSATNRGALEDNCESLGIKTEFDWYFYETYL